MQQSALYIIDALRELVRQTSDDSVYSDEFLYHILNNARIQIMRQYLNDSKPLSPWLYQRFCIKLCPSTFIECNCQPFAFACTVWRSEKPIPQPMTHNGGYIAEFSELYGDLITGVTENESRFLKYRKFNRKMYYMIGDSKGEKYLYLITEITPPKYIKVNAILNDPVDAQYAACSDEECPCLEGNGFPHEAHLLNNIYQISLEFLGLSMSMREDRSNNSEGDLKGFKPPSRQEEQQ